MFYPYVLVLITLTLGLGLITAIAQDAEITEEAQFLMASATATWTPLPTPTLTATIVPSVIPTLTPLPSPTASLTPMVSISATTSLIPESISASAGTATSTIILPEETEAVSVILPEETEAVSVIMPEETETLSFVEPISATIPSIEVITDISGTAIYTPITATATMQAISSTMPTISMTPTIMPTATMGGLPLHYIQGMVKYQNRLIGLDRIRIQAYTQDLVLISEVKSNSDGIYSIAVPIDTSFWLVASAEGHLAGRIFVSANELIPNITLLAGDINQDGCIAYDDLLLIKQSMNTANASSDFNGDAITNMADLAMLTGNYDGNCQTIIASPTSTPEVVAPETTPELMSLTPSDLTITQTPVATVDIIDIEPLDSISGTSELTSNEISSNSSD